MTDNGQDPDKLEARAKEKLTENGWYYASSNAGMSTTHLANRQAFYRHRIIPRMLVDTNKRDTATEIWGHKVSAPIGFAPVGINKIYHPLGELPVAKVAKELNLPYCLSTAGSTSIEDVGKANGDGPRFFQLYMPHDDELTISLLQRAIDSGFSACILTADTWQLGWRHDDVATSNYAFYKGTGADLGLTDPGEILGLSAPTSRYARLTTEKFSKRDLLKTALIRGKSPNGPLESGLTMSGMAVHMVGRRCLGSSRSGRK